MKLWTVLSKANDIFKYLRTRRKRRLYKQWVEWADLPSEAVPQEEVESHIIREKEEKEEKEKKQLQLPILNMLVGACLVILCAILILLIIQSC